MRDRDPADPEILDAGDMPAGAFVEVAVERSGDVGRFRCGVSAAGRSVVQRVLGTRPFHAMPGLPYRYFYAGYGGRGKPTTLLLYVRIELGREARTLDFESPADVVGALEWFRALPSLAAAAHLRVSGRDDG